MVRSVRVCRRWKPSTVVTNLALAIRGAQRGTLNRVLCWAAHSPPVIAIVFTTPSFSRLPALTAARLLGAYS